MVKGDVQIMSNKKYIQNLNNVIFTNHYDLNKLLDSVFDLLQSRNLDPQYMAENAAFSEPMRKYSTGIYRQRRKEALLRILPEVTFKSLTVAEDVSLNNMTTLFSSYEVKTGCDYNQLDKHGEIRLGAAIWVLDRLTQAGTLEQAMQYLPYVGDISEQSLLPKGFYHPCYSKSLLEAMLSALTTRYAGGGEQGLDADRSAENIIQEATARGDGYVAAFQEIIKLLPTEAIDNACTEFRDKVLRIVNIYAKICCFLLDKCDVYDTALNSAEKTVNNLLFSKQTDLIGPVSAPGNTKTLLKYGYLPLSGNKAEHSSTNDYVNRIRTKLNNGLESIQYNLKHKQRMDEVIRNFNPNFKKYFFYDRTQLHDLFDDKECEDLFLNFSVSDPLALCFALIYLLDHGDDAPWLFFSGSTLMTIAYCSLPWGPGQKAGAVADLSFVSDRVPSLKLAHEEGRNVLEHAVDIYSRNNGDLNLAQLFYRLTGCCLPGRLPGLCDTDKALSGLGLSSYETGLYFGAASALYLSSQQARMPEETELFDETEVPECESEEPDEEALRNEAAIADLNSKLSEVNQSYEDIQAELLRAKREIKLLKRSAAEERKKYAVAILQKDKDLEQAHLEHRELADLREVVFSKMHKTETSDSGQDAEAVTLPYETKKRAVIFGGHESFINAMKTFLTNVKYVDIKNMAFNPDLVRNADVVWIQTNRMYHPQYWSIIKIAKQYSVQVRYFRSSGAKSCAMQVITDDRTLGQ